MSNESATKRRPSVHISLQRAARLHRLVRFFASGSRPRSVILSELGLGLRTFYRELELLKKCGVKVRYRQKLYHLVPTATEALGRLPFPDPQLSFAEMAELAACDCAAGRRLAAMLAAVVREPEPAKPGSRRASRSKSRNAGLNR